MKPIFVLVTALACPHTIGLDGRGRPSSTESVPTQSRLHTIPVPLRIFADQPPKLALSVVEGAVQPRSAAFREGHGFSHAESYACSPDPTAHVGAELIETHSKESRR